MNGQIRFFDDLVAPDASEKLVFFHQLPVVFDERQQQIESLRRQTENLIRAPQLPVAGVELEVVKAVNLAVLFLHFTLPKKFGKNYRKVEDFRNASRENAFIAKSSINVRQSLPSRRRIDYSKSHGRRK